MSFTYFRTVQNKGSLTNNQQIRIKIRKDFCFSTENGLVLSGKGKQRKDFWWYKI